MVQHRLRRPRARLTSRRRSGRPAIGAGGPWRRPRSHARSALVAPDGDTGPAGLVTFDHRADRLAQECALPACWACRSIDIAQRAGDLSWCGRAGDEGGNDVGGVSVQGLAAAVVSHGRPGVGVRCRLLDVAERDPGVQRHRDERVTQAVRRDLLADPGPPGQPVEVRSAAERSIRRPPWMRKIGPAARSPRYRSKARDVRGASGTVTWLPPLRTIRSSLRSRPRVRDSWSTFGRRTFADGSRTTTPSATQ